MNGILALLPGLVAGALGALTTLWLLGPVGGARRDGLWRRVARGLTGLAVALILVLVARTALGRSDTDALAILAGFVIAEVALSLISRIRGPVLPARRSDD